MNVMKYKNLGTIAILTAALAGCGADSGSSQATLNRGSLNITADQGTFVSPTQGESGVCNNPTIRIQLNSLMLCNSDTQALNSSVKLMSADDDEIFPLTQFVPVTDTSKGKCEIAARPKNRLPSGAEFRIVLGQDGVLQSNAATFTVSNTEKLCSGGSTFLAERVLGVGGDSKPATTSIEKFGSVDADGNLQFKSKTVGVTFASLASKFITNALFGLGSASRSSFRAVIEFNQAVDPISLNNGIILARLSDQSTSAGVRSLFEPTPLSSGCQLDANGKYKEDPEFAPVGSEHSCLGFFKNKTDGVISGRRVVLKAPVTSLTQGNYVILITTGLVSKQGGLSPSTGQYLPLAMK